MKEDSRILYIDQHQPYCVSYGEPRKGTVLTPGMERCKLGNRECRLSQGDVNPAESSLGNCRNMSTGFRIWVDGESTTSLKRHAVLFK